jgi:hypothetical protein
MKMTDADYRRKTKEKKMLKMKNVAVLLMDMRARAQGWADRPKEKPKNEENTDFMFFRNT